MNMSNMTWLMSTSSTVDMLSSIEFANTTQTMVLNSTTRRILHTKANMDTKVYSPLDIFRLTLTAIIFIVTIAGNIAAIVFICRNKEWRSIKNYYYGYYLINLNVADLLVAIFCIPFTVVYYESKTWRFGWLFCKIMPTTQVIAVSASICTLAVIAWERYRAIIYPMFPRSTIFRLRIKLLCIWLWATIVGAPSYYANNFDQRRKIYQCMESWPSHGYRQGYTVFIFLVNYGIPLSFIFISYIVICVRLKRGETPYGRNVSQMLQNKFIKLMIMLITSFAICYLPGHVCFFMLDFGSGTDNQTFTTVITFAHLLTWINSCLNPFFYCAVGGFLKQQREQMRKSSKHSSASLSVDSFRRSSNRGDENDNELLFLTGLGSNKRQKPFMESFL